MRRGRASSAAVIVAVTVAVAWALVAGPSPALGYDTLLFLGNKNLAPVVYLEGTFPDGLAVDLTRALEPHMSKPIEIRAMDWKQAQAIVASGHADALIQINATPERREVYDFSDPLLESHFAIFVRSDQTGISGISSLRGLRVGVESGGLPQQLLGKDSQIALTAISSFPEGFRMLNSRSVDAVVADYRVGSYALAANRIEGVKVAGDSIASSYSAFAVRKGNSALLGEINGALRAIKKDGTYAEILEQWEPTVGVFETQAQRSERVYRTVTWALLALLAVVAVWALTIRVQMRRRKGAERALAEREETYRSLVAGMAEGVVFQAADGRITAVNPAAERILGRTEAELLARPAACEEMGAIREDGTPFTAQDHPCTVTLRTGEPQTDTLIGVHRPDGTLVWIVVNSVPLIARGETNPHAVVMTFRDVTEHRRADAALKASQEKLALHLRQTLMGVIEWDAAGRVREWNPAAEEIFGYGREEALGLFAADLIASDASSDEKQAEFHRTLHDEGGQFRTAKNITKDGRIILCEWVDTPLTGADGEHMGAMSLVRDVTAQRQAEELKVAKEAAEAANVARSAFLANMSHEIRTPMNAILGFSQILKHDAKLSERQRQQLDIITSSGERLLALVNDVLEMSKVESGRVSAVPAVFDLHTLIDEIQSLYGLRAQARGLALRVQRASDVPRYVVADANKLRQVLVNLLGNAMKFTDAGSVELRVGVRREDGLKLRLLVEVEDTGRGLTPDEAERLLHFFSEAAAGRARQTGPGLGLAISREFVRVLGGEITVESQLGQGSVFCFDIPIEEASAESIPGAGPRRRVVGLRPDGPAPRVLVADDAPDNRELLVQILESVGFGVRSVSNGKEAVKAFIDWRPRLILMDMRMPVVDGYEATRRIRSLEGGEAVSIIGVTASAYGEVRESVFEAGVDEFLDKPVREAELFEKVGGLLGVRYIYAEHTEPTPHNGADVIDPAVFAALSDDIVARIRRAAAGADFDTVLELADEIGRDDERAAAALRSLAERFDADGILSALDDARG
jgi:PAS domain S-box-containing protein